MPNIIVKRNGQEVKFDATKIRNAIFKANVRLAAERFTEADLDQLTAQVVAELEKMKETPTVERTQDIVEEKLITAGYAKTAKAYILYRAQHQRLREMDDELVKIYSALTFVPAEDVDLKRENANINADTAMGTMLKYGSEGAKSFYDKYVIPPHLTKADEEGDIHIHDKDFYTLTETCCQIDLIKLFKNGFSTGHGYLREPKDIRSYAALACIAIQANQNEMHGGQSVPIFDYSMALGVDATYNKEYFKALTQFFQLMKVMPHGQAEAMVEAARVALHSKVTMKNVDQYGERFAKFLPKHQKDNGFEEVTWEEASDAAAYAKETAWRETDKATYQAMEALVHNLNTM
ncbi:MAG: anaerobic ribonucleoside triphosphate reductase, partial [Acutalibacter sp.]|nr:anaerobic ribonucleoside triphosphate reductase [Acutalibacter sp.]